jgi:hypothetical protein
MMMMKLVKKSPPLQRPEGGGDKKLSVDLVLM